jgi:hypothetical protein
LIECSSLFKCFVNGKRVRVQLYSHEVQLCAILCNWV